MYTYDGTGKKLRKTVNGVTTDYANGFIYENNQLQFFSQPEGYFEPSSPPSGELVGAYVYQYKDHLGNIRLSYSDKNNDGFITASTEIVEENNYYPFGLKQKGYNANINGRHHKYMFGGKEQQDELGLNWYDITARNYDPALGRWMNIDPLAERRNWLTPYNFVQNNPILRIDPTGLLDDYGLDQNGKVELIKETDDKTDTLYSVTRNEDGELVKDSNGEVVKNDTNGDGQVADGDSVTVEKGLLNNIENTTYTESDGTKHNLQIMDVSSGSFKDIKSIFEFSSKNSSNEFSFQNYANGNKFISTTFLPSAELSATTLIRRNGKLLHHVHSHPGQDYFAPSPGDISSASYLIKKYGTRLEMYSPLLGTYKDYNGESSSFELDEIIITPKKKKKN